MPHGTNFRYPLSQSYKLGHEKMRAIPQASSSSPCPNLAKSFPGISILLIRQCSPRFLYLSRNLKRSSRHCVYRPLGLFGIRPCATSAYFVSRGKEEIKRAQGASPDPDLFHVILNKHIAAKLVLSATLRWALTPTSRMLRWLTSMNSVSGVKLLRDKQLWHSPAHVWCSQRSKH